MVLTSGSQGLHRWFSDWATEWTTEESLGLPVGARDLSLFPPTLDPTNLLFSGYPRNIPEG